MKPELYWVHDIAPHRLAVMPRPRGGEWLRDEVEGWKAEGVDAVISLLEAYEVRFLELNNEASLCAAAGIAFISFPIPDRGTPTSHSDAVQRVAHAAGQISAGRSVAVHCRAGIGRTGLVSGAILANLGVPPANIFPLLSRARTLPMPDTQAQADWVMAYCRNNVAGT